MDAARAIHAQLEELCDELEEMLKRPDVGAALTERGVNTSIALLAVQGIAAYLRGDRAPAADDLSTAAEELRARLAASRERDESLS